MIDFFVGCCQRLMASKHKRYIVLFVALASFYLRSAVEAVELILGGQAPQWIWNVIILACITAGICWLNLMREVPHVEPTDKRVQWTRQSR